MSSTNNKLARTSELGQSLPLIVLMFIVLCGFIGMTIDVGNGMLQKRRLQAAVDLGLISGARALPDANAAANEAKNYVNANFKANSGSPINITTTTGCMTPGCAKYDRMTLKARFTTPTFFVRLFGVDTWSVAAQGAACGPCDSTPVNFDVMIVLDRSGSMSSTDMSNARTGIKQLLKFFDPARDRIGLTILDSSDTAEPYFHTGSPPCDTPKSNFTSTSYLSGAYTSYGGGAGAFMDKSPTGGHDTWVVVSLAQGTNYKLANGNVNESSTYVSALNCIKNQGSTPIGPAVEAAHNELLYNGREDAVKVMVYLGDGGASSMPLERQCRSRTASNKPWGAWRACLTSDSAGGDNIEWKINGNKSWYQWTGTSPGNSVGNRDRPCQDAITQSQLAHNDGIDVYTIGYGVGTDWCRPGLTNSSPESPQIRQSDTIKRMASDPDKYYSQARGDLSEVFSDIARDITGGGTRLVE